MVLMGVMPWIRLDESQSKLHSTRKDTPPGVGVSCDQICPLQRTLVPQNVFLLLLLLLTAAKSHSPPLHLLLLPHTIMVSPYSQE
jgi:hypothetical protein